MREVAVGLSTTGLGPIMGHRVAEVAAIELELGRKTGRSFHAFVNPERDIPYLAFVVHGLTREFLSDKALFDEIGGELREFINGSKLIAHHAEDLIFFLDHEMKQAGHDRLQLDDIVDTIDLVHAKRKNLIPDFKTLRREFNIRIAREKPGKAMWDAKIVVHVYKELVYGAEETAE